MAQTIQELLEQSDSFKGEVQEIYEVINEEVTTDAVIEATSESKVAEHRLWAYIVAGLSWLQQTLWDRFKAELTAIKEEIPTCNARWFADEVRKFQYGDALLFDATTRKYYYETIDEELQIVSRVAVLQGGGKGTIKVAKDNDGSPEALTNDELEALQSYVKKIQPTGSNITVISRAADLIRLPLTITYDPIVPLATIKANVEAAILNYLATLDFAGTFYTIRLVDAVQSVAGIIDVAEGTIQATQDGGDLADISRKYIPVSGYLAVHPDYELDDTLTYTAG